MLPHYSPLKVAEQFSMLSGLAPGRIDLGLGRAPGTDQLTMLALQRDRNHVLRDDFPEQLTELLGLPRGPHGAQPSVRAAGAHAARACPSGPSRGCSARRRRAASGPASWGCRTRSRTSSTRRAPRSRADYRARFVDSERLAGAALVAVGVNVICAETDEEAAAAGGERPDGVLAAAPGAPDRDPAGREGAALLGVARVRAARPGGGRPARDHRLARDRARRARGGRAASTGRRS